MKILFLYTELAEYTLACLRALKRGDMAIELMVIHYPVNPEAPFQLSFEGIGEFRSIDSKITGADLRSIIAAFQPTMIVCSGWGDKRYVETCRAYNGRIPTVLTMDNHWEGKFRQRLLVFVSRFMLHTAFSHCWVPGKSQADYAQRLGFRPANIFTGFYCCDLERFNKMYEDSFSSKAQSFPRKLICVARYIPPKNYATLWNAFVRWQQIEPNDWELWCAGTGVDYPDRMENPGIRHLGFVLPEDWSPIIQQTGVFVLPSLFEPWGVVVQEFAASGYPLVLSERVGSSAQFLQPNNGFTFEPESEDQLIACFQKLSRMTGSELSRMGQRSHDIANQLSLESWVSTIKQISRQHVSI